MAIGKHDSYACLKRRHIMSISTPEDGQDRPNKPPKRQPPSHYYCNPQGLKPAKSSWKPYFRDDHRCHQLPCDCRVWNKQRRAVREYLFASPVGREDFLNRTWLDDTEFWQTHSSIDPDTARSQLKIERLAPRICEINDIFEETKLPYYIDGIPIAGTHGKKRYFLVTGMTASELKALRKRE
jgi:hypothetical protein